MNLDLNSIRSRDINVRELLERHRIATIVVSSLVILASIVCFICFNHAGPSRSLRPPTRAYFTTNDGNTLFVDAADKRPPFDHDGAQAVRAVVFTCDGGKHHWVQFLEKYADNSPSSGSADAASAASFSLPRAGGLGLGLLVKRPGDTQWVSSTDTARFTKISIPKPPDGTANESIEPYNP